jgi:hypothetical protein
VSQGDKRSAQAELMERALRVGQAPLNRPLP